MRKRQPGQCTGNDELMPILGAVKSPRLVACVRTQDPGNTTCDRAVVQVIGPGRPQMQLPRSEEREALAAVRGRRCSACCPGWTNVAAAAHSSPERAPDTS